MLRQQVQELSELVSIDQLTGLHNARQFDNLLQAEMDRSKRSGIPTSLIMLETDHFNQINQDCGVDAGDFVLQEVASILLDEVRTTDVVFRYSDQVFALIFPETHLNLAVKVADRIRETIATRAMIHESHEFAVSASIGASVYVKFSILERGSFVESVSNYLQEAQQSGGNCICHIDYNDLRSVTEVGFDERAMLFGVD